jgi:FtsZ-binding cell division protein ZapB
MFSQGSKLAVLESKLAMYEDLSREMLDKLETAVQKISEGNSRIATILAKHDERIDQNYKTDQLIIKMVDELKEESKGHCSDFKDRIDKMELRLEEFVKFRWIIVGIALFASFAFSQSSVVVDILTPDHQPARIESTK